MAIDHEAPFAALASRIQTYCREFISRPVSRRLLSWDQIGQAEKTAIAVVAISHSPGVGGPESAIWTLTAAVVIYSRADADPGSSAEPSLNRVIGSIESALERQSDETVIGPGQQIQRWTTLGGTVVWARPGPVEMEAGSVGNEGLAIMTVEMLPMPV